MLNPTLAYFNSLGNADTSRAECTEAAQPLQTLFRHDQ
jgi:hypothetical protein